MVLWQRGVRQRVSLVHGVRAVVLHPGWCDPSGQDGQLRRLDACGTKDFDGNGSTDHCGIVENVLSGGVVAIEGNTAQGNDANGGQVQRRVRASRLIVGALRPQYTKEAKMDNTPGKYAEEAVRWALESGLMQGSADGDLKLHDSVTREQLMVFLYRLRKMG